MLRKIFTAALAIVAVAGAFAGSSNAKSLLQDAGWVINGQEGLHSTLSASAACTLGEQTCAYEVDTQGNPTGDRFYMPEQG
jgi:hypothetical protein